MKSLMRLLEKILADASIWCSTSTTRDLVTVTRRVNHEGLSFIMITLPYFCSEFERALSLGKVDRTMFLGFKRHKALPRFLRGLLGLVFDASTGVLVDIPNTSAIWFIRQVCLMFKKLECECSNARVSAAFDRYIDTNDQVADWELYYSKHFCYESLGSFSENPSKDESVPLQLRSFREVASMLWSGVLEDRYFDPEQLIPKHGPGATAERISANAKYVLKTWYSRLEPSFPLDLFGIPSWNFISDLERIDLVDPVSEIPVRVIQVPKTLKTPRIIAMEPVCMQYTQQALLEVVVPILENHVAFSNALGFTDQTVNQNLARIASETGHLATIDLKDASDRVSAKLVFDMLATTPRFRDALFACRSYLACVPGREVIHLSRFASMGSAMCFPIEAMVFYNIIVSAIARSTGCRFSPKLLTEISKSVRIYGDDIIVPVDCVQIVKDELEWFNLQVNTGKSFDTGKFRESCGMDAYNGVPVTPVYVRRMPPDSRLSADRVVSYFSLRNQLYENGCWETVKYIDKELGRICPTPTVLPTSPLLGFLSFLPFRYDEGKWEANRQLFLLRGLVVRSQPRKSPLDDFGALMKFFLKRGSDPTFDRKHLQQSGRPEAVYTKLQWAPGF